MPFCAKTLKRVPELPNAQDGSSICWQVRLSLTAAVSGMGGVLRIGWCEAGKLIFEVEDLRDEREVLIGVPAADVGEEGRHVVLPPLVNRCPLHGSLRSSEVVGLDEADQQAVISDEQRVISPPCVAQRGEHLRPEI